MRIKISIESIIFLLFKLFFIIDSINGILYRTYSVNINLSQIYKVILLALMLTGIAKYSFKKLIIAYAVLSFFLILSYYHFLLHPNVGFLKQDIGISLKLLSVPISFIFFECLSKNHYFELNKEINSIINWSFGVIACNLILGILGIGYSQYDLNDGESVGTVGFFITGNEVSGIMLAFASIIGVKLWSLHKGKYWLFMAFLLILSILKATKVAMLGSLILIFTIPVISEWKVFYKLTILRLKLMSFFILSIPLVILFFVKAIEMTGLITRFRYFYDKLDFFTFIFSGRNLVSKASIQAFINDFNLWSMFLGIGDQLSLESVIPYFGVPHMVEIDFFDVLIRYGIFGVIFVYGLWFFFIIRSKNTKYRNEYINGVFISNVLLFIIAHLSGHIFYAGMITFFVGMFNGTLKMKLNEAK